MTLGSGDSAPLESYFRVSSQAIAFIHVLLWLCDVTIRSPLGFTEILQAHPQSTSVGQSCRTLENLQY